MSEVERSSLTLERVAACLDWPDADSLMTPSGGGPAVLAELARDKIGRGLSHLLPSNAFRTGLLTADPSAESTESPLAIIIEFSDVAASEVLREAHRLAWNFSHSPTLITIEPDLVRVWTCCETPPGPDRPLEPVLVHEVAGEVFSSQTSALEAQAARVLHWLNLVSGEFFTQHADRFDRDGRADQLLLRNLRHIREILAKDGLRDDDVCHDLLARVIFIQFLFDRRDADGKPALNADSLAQLHTEGRLSNQYNNFASILTDYDDAYELFAWLNLRFNGDLFPGKGETPDERAIGWNREKQFVQPQHLSLLADFIQGNLDMPSGQGCLWPLYSFDVIPLEFISSIYETFVTENASREGIFYTPPHLVDFVLDQVLPWRGTEWNLKILDPSCGSGIFLVKSFQRLVYRWKQAHPGRSITAEILCRLLTDNLLGVDKDPHAVRVACFSLYLAMCDEIEPRHYWSQIRFPDMRDRRLICSDFFADGQGFSNAPGVAGDYDLVVGNAPWGDGLATELSNTWAKRFDWTVANKDIGGLFLAKGARLLKDSGQVAMIQSANALLFNSSGPAKRFRRQLFTHHQVRSVFNLSALRFKVFKRKTHTTKTSVSPACVVVLRPNASRTKEALIYASPKPLDLQLDDFAIVIEPHHIHRLPMATARDDSTIWTTLMWGTPRDAQLLAKLNRFPKLATLKAEQVVRTRQGVVFGDKARSVPELDGRRLLLATQFTHDASLELDASELPIVDGLKVHSRDSSDYSAFATPQVLIKQSYQSGLGRFQARLVANDDGRGIICSESYVSATGPSEAMNAACLVFNSLVATYFMQLSSGRMAAYRPEAYVHQILDVPLPLPERIAGATPRTFTEIDTAVFDGFRLKPAERALIEDMTSITIPDFRGDQPSPGAASTQGPAGEETTLTKYCETFISVLRAGFGQSKAVGATIFTAPSDDPAPYRLVAISLLVPGSDDEGVRIAPVGHLRLIKELRRLSAAHPQGGARILGQRLARFYDASAGTPTIFLLKPDATRYWTRSMALNDADQVSVDLFIWTASTRSPQE